MSKGHRDNHAARVKRGTVAFAKKAARRQPESTCKLCGQSCRAVKLTDGICPICVGRMVQIGQNIDALRTAMAEARIAIERTNAGIQRMLDSRGGEDAK